MEKILAPRSGPPPAAITLAGVPAKSRVGRVKPAVPTALWVPAVRRKADERRTFSRHRVRKGAFALIRPEAAGLGRIDEMSMGGIACAVFRCRPMKIGQIRDISAGGVSFSYIDGGSCAEEACQLDILVADNAFYLENLPFRTVTDREVSDATGFDVIKIKIAGLQFRDLRPGQADVLNRFLRRYTLGC